ncbi:MAG TPA: GvpL/GvpF family gas vesicle protein [Thermoanaerobaculia bacterium]|nr:GvpL/GvpF family gas vesicle protein [Thermoanaerobaculia bacterium]
MKRVVIGAHLRREDIEPLAEAIPVRDLFLSGIGVNDDQPLGDRELLLRVAQTRARLLDRATFIAIRYGLAVTNDAESKCGEHAARWHAVLEANRDNVEMTLKVAAATSVARPNRKDFTSGTAYLKALHDATRAATIDPAFRDEVDRTLVPLTVAHRWIPRDNASLECAALVARAKLDEIASVGEAIKRACPNVPFLLSGPWPLEVFADADHE